MWTHSASTHTCLCGPARLLPSPCGYSNLSGQSCCSAQPQPGKQEKAELPPHLWLIQALPSAVRNQAYEGHSGSPVLFPSLIPSLQNVPNLAITEESYLLDEPQREPRSPEAPGLMANVLAPSSTALISASTEPWNLCSPSTSTQDYQVPSFSSYWGRWEKPKAGSIPPESP